MDCNKCTSWDEYSDLSDGESKQKEEQFIIDAKIHLFLRKYTSFPLKVNYFLIFIFFISQKEELIEVFVQSNFDEEEINLILEQKLIEKLKRKKSIVKDNEENKDEKKINQSKNDSWKENKENNIKFKNKKYKGHNNYNTHYNNHYNNHSNNFFYHNKKHYKDYKDYKNYKSPYNQQQSNSNNHTNHKQTYIEKEVELNSKGETEGDSEIKTSDNAEDNNRRGSHDYNLNNNLDINGQETNEDINLLENLNLNFKKTQSEDLSVKNTFDFHDIGIKLFPGAFRYNQKNIRDNTLKENNYINNSPLKENYGGIDYNLENKNDLECHNYICKSNNNNTKQEPKNGLALAFEYYSSFLEDKIK